MMVVAPDKTQTVLIETKLVHDETNDGYRWRKQANGSSIAGDIEKLGRIPPAPGRSKFLMVLMAAVTSTESPADWRGLAEGGGATPGREKPPGFG